MIQTPPPSWGTFLRRSYAFPLGLFLFGLAGMFFVMGWAFVVNEQQYLREGQSAEGIVLTKSIQRTTHAGRSGMRTQTDHTVVYRFAAGDGRSYERSQNISLAAWERLRQQAPVQVHYVASSPSTSRIAGERGLAIEATYIGLGAVAGLAGIVVLWRSLVSARNKARIWVQGISADAIVAAVEKTRVKINRRPMWIIRYRYRDHSGHAHDGRSEYLAADPANTWKQGDRIRVRFDPQKPDVSVWVE